MKNAFLLASLIVMADLIAFPQPAQAIASMYIEVAYDGIDLDRMVRNIEEQINKFPDNPMLRLNLARAHALYFALNPATPKKSKDGGMVPAVYDSHPNEIFSMQMPQDIPRQPLAAAHAHLEQAIQLYSVVLKMPAGRVSTAHTHSASHSWSLALLGRGWCREQAGDKQGAIEDYRTLLNSPQYYVEHMGGNESWSDESAEAATYLVKLLDPERDKAEIAELKAKIAKFNYRGLRYITPIAIPLDRNAPLAEIEDKSARVAFDVDVRHPGQHWSWITPKAGWLAYDPKKTGKIVSGIRLFGNVSYWMFWDNGYQAMSALDDNGDGMLSGKELDGLVVWVDENRNGVCDPGEIRTLAELHIKALSYRHVPLKDHPDHIVYAPQGVQYDDGSSGPSYDIILHAKP